MIGYSGKQAFIYKCLFSEVPELTESEIMFLTQCEQWFNSKGEPHPSESIRIEFFESTQQALEEFEKLIHQDMWIFSGYRSKNVHVTDTNRYETKVFSYRDPEHTIMSVKTYQLSDIHPITRNKGF